MLLAVLLKHQGLTEVVARMIEEEIEKPGEQHKLPRGISESMKAVQQTKWKLIRSRQEQVCCYLNQP